MTCESETSMWARVGLKMNEFAEFKLSAEYILSELDVLECCL
jgi:hypothetical protein